MKRLLRWPAIAGTAILLAACGASNAAPSAPPSSAAAKPSAPASSPAAPAASAKPAVAASAKPAAAASAKPAASGAAPASAATNPNAVKIRYGREPGAEEPLWLMNLMPQIAPNYGKLYTVDYVPFRANADRLTAYQANQIDGGGITVGTAFTAQAEGVDMKLVASIWREKEGPNLFVTTAYALTSSGIKSAADLKGKKFAIVDHQSSTDLWAREAIKKAGLNPERDVEEVVLPFPAQPEAMRSHKVDAIMETQPWAGTEEAKGDVTKIFTSVSALGFEHEAGDIFFRPSFIAQHQDAVKAFLSDYIGAIKWWQNNRLEGTKKLIDAKYELGDANVLSKLPEYYRPPDAKIDIDSLNRLQDLQFSSGWMSKKVDISQLATNSLLPS